MLFDSIFSIPFNISTLSRTMVQAKFHFLCGYGFVLDKYKFFLSPLKG